jgi:subtilisin family serine protease
MRMPVRRNFLAGGIAAVTAAALGVFVSPTGSQAFAPVSYGPALPATVSADQPVRILTTTRDATGRPVFTVTVATDKAEAGRLIARAEQDSATVSVEVDGRKHALGGVDPGEDEPGDDEPDDDEPGDDGPGDDGPGEDEPGDGEPGSDDPMREHQWDLEKINAPAAWSRTLANAVLVAVVDTGVDGTHPDLGDNVADGYDAINDAEGGATDENGHGTHVAGTIAAKAGNGEGIVGVAPEARILPVKVLDGEGSGYDSDIAEGIVWAADAGAQVINLSLGGPDQSEAISEAVDYARGKNAVVIAAAGNSREEGSPVEYPAADEGVIAVAATDDQDEVAEFSNAGDYVDVAAPGTGIMSTVPGGEYEKASGTSMAAPHVAGVAALMVGYRSSLTPDQVEEFLESSAFDLGDEGFDNDYGNGRINANSALDAIDGGGERITPEITTGVTADRVAYGTKTRTTFTISDGKEPLAGQKVDACVAVGGADWDCDAATVDKNGRYVLTHVATGAFEVRVTVPETRKMNEASASASYRVSAVVKATRAGKGAITVKIGGAMGQKMTLQRLVGGKWKTAKTYTATANRKITGLASGDYRVMLAATSTLEGVTTGKVKV